MILSNELCSYWYLDSNNELNEWFNSWFERKFGAKSMFRYKTESQKQIYSQCLFFNILKNKNFFL